MEEDKCDICGKELKGSYVWQMLGDVVYRWHLDCKPAPWVDEFPYFFANSIPTIPDNIILGEE